MPCSIGALPSNEAERLLKRTALNSASLSFSVKYACPDGACLYSAISPRIQISPYVVSRRSRAARFNSDTE